MSIQTHKQASAGGWLHTLPVGLCFPAEEFHAVYKVAVFKVCLMHLTFQGLLCSCASFSIAKRASVYLSCRRKGILPDLGITYIQLEPELRIHCAQEIAANRANWFLTELEEARVSSTPRHKQNFLSGSAKEKTRTTPKVKKAWLISATSATTITPTTAERLSQAVASLLAT